jgi:hypothetical protein
MDQQVDGQTAQQRRLVAKKRISVGLEMGVLRIPHIKHENIKGFQKNLLQKSQRQGRLQPMATLHTILAGLLNRANRLIHADHTQRIESKQGKITCNKLKYWKKLLWSAFHAVTDFLEAY